MSWEERPYADGSYGPAQPHPRFSENPLGWSLGVGRIAGVQVRVHFVFLFYIGMELLVARNDMWFLARLLGLLFGTVLVHELGHCFAARSVGGFAREVLLWPLGGLAYVRAPQTPYAQFVTTAGGPAVNVAICLLIAPLLAWFGGTLAAIPLNPFNMFAALAYLTAEWQVWLLLAYCVSYWLLLFNLLPMFPLDGGRLLQAIVWPYVGLPRAVQIATTAGMVGAIALGLLGFAQGHFMLVAIAIFGYMTCLNERRMVAAGLIYDETPFGYDFSGGYSTLDGEGRGRRRGLRGWWARRRARRALERAERERQQAQREEAEVDRILLKVHEQGMHTLTRAERRTLETATRRKRAMERKVS